MPMGFPGRGCGSFEMIEALETLYSGQFTLSTQLIVINPQRRRIAVSLETYPLYSFSSNDVQLILGNISWNSINTLTFWTGYKNKVHLLLMTPTNIWGT